MWQKLKLKHKLIILICISLLPLALTTYFDLNDAFSISTGYVASLYSQCYQGISLILNADRDMYQARVAQHLLYHTDKQTLEYQKTIDFYKENVEQAEDRVRQARDLIAKNASVLNYKHKDSGKTALESFDLFNKTFLEWKKVSDSLAGDYELKDVDLISLNHKLHDADAEFEEPRESLNQIGELLDSYAKELMETYQQKIVRTLISNLVGVLFTLICVFIVIRSIIRPLNKAIQNLTEGALQTSAASNQLASYSQQLSESNAEQVSSIEETSTTLEQAASMVRQNTENTRQAAILSKNANTSADQGNLEMQEMMLSMFELKKSSDQISKIIKVIDEIAFQTNILALNAAIEAARAGEAGAGFAVVAEEVRNLAQRSAQAAKDTEVIIEGNIELSEKGVKVAEKVKTVLSEITLQAKKVSELMEEVAAASQEHYQGIAQINNTMAQMEQSIQKNAANAEESASASEELSVQAENLKEIVFQLVKLVEGRTGTTHLEREDGSFVNKIQANTMETKKSLSFNHLAVKKLEKNPAEKTPDDVSPFDEDSNGF